MNRLRCAVTPNAKYSTILYYKRLRRVFHTLLDPVIHIFLGDTGGLFIYSRTRTDR